MWQRFTERARRVVFFAQDEAGRRLFNMVDSEHLLLGMLRENDNVAMSVLRSMSIDVKNLEAEVRRVAPRGEKLEQMDMQLTSASKRAIDLAYEEAQRLNNNYIGTEHLLMGLLREEQGIAGQQLASHGVELAAVRVSVAAFQGSAAVEAARKATLAATEEKNESTASADRLSESAQRIVRFAQYEARELGENFYSTEHLLLGLLRENSDCTTEILQRLGLTPDAIKSALMRHVARDEGYRATVEVTATPRAKRVLDMAQRTATAFGDARIEPEHLLMGLINEREGLAGRVLLSFGINSNNAMNAFRAARPNDPKISAESKLTSLEVQLEALRQRLEKLPGGPEAGLTEAESEVKAPSPLFGDLGVARPTAGRTQIEVAHDAAAFRKLLAVFLAKDAFGYRSLTEGDQTVFLLPADTRLKLLVPPPDCENLFAEGYHVRVLEGDYAGYAGWIVKAAFQRTGFDAAEFPPTD